MNTSCACVYMHVYTCWRCTSSALVDAGCCVSDRLPPLSHTRDWPPFSCAAARHTQWPQRPSRPPVLQVSRTVSCFHLIFFPSLICKFVSDTNRSSVKRLIYRLYVTAFVQMWHASLICDMTRYHQTVTVTKHTHWYICIQTVTVIKHTHWYICIHVLIHVYILSNHRHE